MPQIGSPDPVLEWSEARVRAHLLYLDGAEVEGRQTASRGYTRAAIYVAGHLRDMGLQPVVNREFRWQYAARIQRSLRHEIMVTFPDTLRWTQGVDWIFTDVPEEFHAAGTGLPLPDIPFVRWQEGSASAPSGDARWDIRFEVQQQVTSAPMHVAARF